LEQEIVAWGMEWMKWVDQSTHEAATLDAYCTAVNLDRIAMLERNGFLKDLVQTIHLTRDLTQPITAYSLPGGYNIRLAQGEKEIDRLVDLHRAAFESEQMTVEYRRAIMSAPQYASDMDWVVAAPNGDLAAFCLGSIEESDPHIGYLDPIGVHPLHWGKGLGTAILTYGLNFLEQRRVTSVLLGTSSENTSMLKLAEKTGFVQSSASLWFSKKVE